nr:LuxR C-terminal-related transcriptional regulator [Lautropia mirabilis]
MDRQIAGDLNICIKMVEAHRASIMDKFEARTMADLMRRFLGSSPD